MYVQYTRPFLLLLRMASQQQNVPDSQILIFENQIFEAGTILNLKVSVNGIMAELFSS